MSLISEELEQIKVAQGFFNKLLLLIVTGRLTALLGMLIGVGALLCLGTGLFLYPAKVDSIITWLGIIGGSTPIAAQATSLGHSWLNKLKGPDHIHVGPAGTEQIIPMSRPAS